MLALYLPKYATGCCTSAEKLLKAFLPLEYFVFTEKARIIQLNTI